MSDVTRILSQIDAGNPKAAEQLLPLVYNELRKLAAAKLAHEKPGQTLQATALVHEAYVRLVGGGPSEPAWDNRGHFFQNLLLHSPECGRIRQGRILANSATSDGGIEKNAL